MGNLLHKIQRGLKAPPHILIKRILIEARSHAERFSTPRQLKKFTLSKLLQATQTPNLATLWQHLAKRPYPAFCQPISIDEYNQYCPQDAERIIAQAENALEGKFEILGVKINQKPNTLNWSKDYRLGHVWAIQYIKDIKYPIDNADVKLPWELSRLQWLMPAGQAYLLTQNERYAQTVKEVITDWIEKNPYAMSINWQCTMEVALRIITWTWFFHVFHRSAAWQDPHFQQLFLRQLFLHASFTHHHLEVSTNPGNHYTSNAAGLLFAGLFFSPAPQATQWEKLGWKILKNEMIRQVTDDGVDFEASTAYHRLVAEFFLLPALFEENVGHPIPDSYLNKIIGMGHFAHAYAKPNGLSPLWGDADDARTLPFGGQPMNDHRYLSNTIGLKWNIAELIKDDKNVRAEIFWLLGPSYISTLINHASPTPLQSVEFKDSGFYIMRNESDHIFIDCGAIGQGGIGGHGHNDCLSFEAVLDGVPLISDCGTYLYLASFKDRNLFRSTSYHNTPMYDNCEINRFISYEHLWTLHYDAKPKVLKWETREDYDLFVGSHTGYERLIQPVEPVRTIQLLHKKHSLIIHDEFKGRGKHQVEIPLHLSLGTHAKITETPQLLTLTHQEKTFYLWWTGSEDGSPWKFEIRNARLSPSFGVVFPTQRLTWVTKGEKAPLTVLIIPATLCETLPTTEWLQAFLKEHICGVKI